MNIYGSSSKLVELQKELLVLIYKWIEKALSYNLKPLNDFVNTIYNNYNGIMLSFKTNITNAISEGINSVIQLAKSRARGFRNIENFMAMIYFLGNSEIYATHEK